MSSEIARLASRVAALERQLARTTRTARMAYSSIEDGAIEVYDRDGNLRGSIGLQDDDTVGFVAHNGPPPPTPTPPVIESALSGLTVTWSGTWAKGETAPVDLAEVQIHTSVTSDSEPDTSRPLAAFLTAVGGSITIATGTYDAVWVRLVAVNTSGTAGEPSAAVQGKARKAVPDDLVNAIIDETKLARGAVTNAALALGAVNSTALADGAVLAEKLAANSVTLGKLASGAVTAPALAVDSVIAGKIAADAVTGREIAANSVTAAEIAAASISADKLVVAGGTNVLSDPSFEGLYTAAIAKNEWSVVSGGNGSAKALRVDAAAATVATRSLNLTTFPILGGDQLYLAIDANASANWAGEALKFYARWQDGSGSTVGYGVAGTDAPIRGSWQRLAATVTAPTTTTVATVWVESFQATAGDVLWDNAVVRPLVPGVQIADGAITAPKLLAGSVTTEKLLALAVTAEKIATLAVTTDKLYALAVTADKLAANAVTATKIAAGSIEATHIKAGAITADKLDAEAINGKVVTGATVRTAADGRRIVLNPFSDAQPALEIFSGSASETSPGRMRASVINTGTWVQPEVVLESPLVASSRADVTLRSPELDGTGLVRLEPSDQADGHAHATVENGGPNDDSTITLYGSRGSNAGGGYHSMVLKGAGITWHSDTRQMTFADGVLRAPNIVTGVVTVTPTANTPTSITVSGLNIPGTIHRAFVTASSTVPGTVVECTATNVTASGLTVWVNRTTATNTTVWYLIVGS
ncbi:hypothetical protein [Streptomyces sp. NPDC001815]|uniref:hypothetical protein n=1 Tax=Streptomyces sp. NPDC001815 TaxID=3154526 RepID=UPI00331F33F6